MDVPEKDIQKEVAKRLDAAGAVWFHPPNEARRSFKLANYLRGQGMKAGVPDVMIIGPQPKHLGYTGAAIELKKLGGGKPSDAQQRWLLNLADAGWYTKVAYGMDEAMSALDYLGW